MMFLLPFLLFSIPTSDMCKMKHCQPTLRPEKMVSSLYGSTEHKYFALLVLKHPLQLENLPTVEGISFYPMRLFKKCDPGFLYITQLHPSRIVSGTRFFFFSCKFPCQNYKWTFDQRPALLHIPV